MGVVQDYIGSLPGETQALIRHMYDVARQELPDDTAGEMLSYNLPALTYDGKSVIAIVQNKHFISLYPFSGQVITTLQRDLTAYECTTGSIHLDANRPLPDELLQKIVRARLAEIRKR